MALIRLLFLSLLSITFSKISAKPAVNINSLRPSQFDLFKTTDSNVAKINVYFIDAKKDSILCNVIKYDPLGRLSTILTLRDGKNIEEMIIKKYFENTDIITDITTTSYLTEKPSVQITAYRYDSLFRKRFSYEFDKDTTKITTHQYIYDKNNLFKINYMSGDDTVFHTKSLLYYDDKNRKIKTDFYDKNKHVIFSEVNEYTGNTCNGYLINKTGKFLLSTYEYQENKLIKLITPEKNERIDGDVSSIKLTTYKRTVDYFYDNTGRLKDVIYKFDSDNNNRHSGYGFKKQDISYKLTLKYYYR